ncbi:MAG: hypothetical protein AAB911_00085 [Patescibacteria group bacterium]
MSTLLKERIIFKNGKPQAVVLDIDRYKKLLEIAQEKEDLAELRQIKKSKTYFRDLQDYTKDHV